jgi:FSR family fosmidomycin resistance protein-like MFS transporter
LNLFRDRAFLAAGISHLMVDLINSQRALVLAVLSVPLQLSNSVVGGVSALYTFIGSLTQPLFGHLADRFGGRWVVTGGLLWLAVMFGLAVTSQGYGALVLLVLAAFGSAAFHPAGTMEASQRGLDAPTQQETIAASVFFLFGQGGLSFGPAIGGPILDLWGTPGLLLIVVFAVPVSLYANLGLRPGDLGDVDAVGVSVRTVRSDLREVLGLFILMTGLRSWAQMNMITFVPKYYAELGVRPGVYGILAALFMGGAAVGGVIGGWFADRFGKRPVVIIALIYGVAPLALFPYVASTGWAYPVILCAGVFIGAPHSVFVIMAQRLLPNNVGVASGLVLGFTFTSGAVGTLISGFQADLMGFQAMFLTTSLLALAAAAIAWVMRRGWGRSPA